MQNRDQRFKLRGELPAASVERGESCVHCGSRTWYDRELSFYPVQFKIINVSIFLHVFVLIHAEIMKSAIQIGTTFSIYAPAKSLTINITIT